MSQAVLISIRPKWCELIASGKKTIEVRKTAPKIETPFKCYIYCTKLHPGEPDSMINLNGRTSFYMPQCGAVIGEFVCAEIDRYARYGWLKEPARYMKSSPGGYPATEIHYASLQLSPNALEDYGQGAPLFGWHISELKIYDRPRKLSDFKRWNRSEENSPCAHMKWLYEPCETCSECNLKRPPQSYCYVEETRRYNNG